MVTYHEVRKSVPLVGLYRVRTWYLFGVVPMFRRWEQLTCYGDTATASEME